MNALVLVVLVVLLAIISVWVAALIVAVKTPAHLWPDGGKTRGLVRILLLGALGAVIFFARSYPQMRKARESAPPETGKASFSAFDGPWE